MVEGGREKEEQQEQLENEGGVVRSWIRALEAWGSRGMGEDKREGEWRRGRGWPSKVCLQFKAEIDGSREERG